MLFDGVFLNLDSVLNEVLDMLESCVLWWESNGIIVAGIRYNYFEIGLALLWVWLLIQNLMPWISGESDMEENESEANVTFWGVD